MAVETGAREDATRRRASVMGQWDSAVTSYYLIAGAATLLTLIGVVMVLSSSSVYSLSITRGSTPYTIFMNHGRYALIGLPLMFLASRLPVRFYRRMAWPALLSALFMQLLVFTPLGKEVNGNRNWIEVGGQSVQPSEAAKLALALWLGVVLARKRHLLDQWMHVLVPGVIGGLLVLAGVLAGHDLGTAIVIVLLMAGALFVAGVPLRVFGVAGVVGLVGIAFMAASSGNRMHRITAHFSDDCDIQGACWQTMRGLYGLGSGGLTGVGLGESREKWLYLPEAHNDFIFAILGEELGLLGTLLVVVLFGVLAIAMTRVIRRHADPFVQVTTAGVAAWVLGQAIINMAVVIGLLPVIGVPLPLVSAGGSALIMTLLALGVVLAFARNEPGASEALTARGGVVRRSLAVLGASRRPRA
jgi:cell division protein FtsW